MDYEWLKNFSIREIPHKQYLNDYLTGKYPEAVGRGELYNSDPISKDARLCGTTASLCGLEKALYEQDEEAIRQATEKVIMLHAYLLAQSGIPVLYSGEEIGQLNDYSYHEDPMKCEDSRYLHRGKFQWNLQKKIYEEGTSQHQIFSALQKLETFRPVVFAGCIKFNSIKFYKIRNSTLTFGVSVLFYYQFTRNSIRRKNSNQ